MKNLTPILIAAGLYLLLRPRGSVIVEADKAIREAQQAGLQRSYTDLQYSTIANVIYESLKDSWIADDKGQAERALLLMLNDLDVSLLIKAYGRRTHRMFGIPDGGPKDLAQAISGELSESRKANINRDYGLKGIRFRWV